MALARFEHDFTDALGNLIGVAGTVEVRREDTGALAVPYSDRNGTTALGNPFSVTDGQVAFHVVGGSYKVTLTYGAETRTLRYQAIGTGAEYDAEALGKVGYAYEFETTTTAPPSASSIRANNADLSLATKLYIDDETLGNADISNTLLGLDPNGNLTKNKIRLTVGALDAVFDVEAATDQTNYVELTVSGHDGSTALTTGTCRMNFEWAGSDIADGTITSSMKSAATIAKDEGFDTIADFIADTGLTYTTSQPGTVASGDIILAGGYRLQVVASGASDNHLANANGTPVKVKVLKRNNTWPMLAFNPNADGVTDDKAKIDLVNNSGEVVDLGGKSYEYNGTFTPAATFINGSIIDDNQTRDYTVKTANDALFSAQGPRSIIRYYSATQIQIGAEKNFVMGGFRFHGKYLNGASKLFPAPALSDDCRHIISIGDGATTAGDLGAESYSSIHSWYALFACANDGDSAASFKVMPFLRVKSIAGSAITLNDAGENQRSLNTKTYQFTTNNLAGVDCLVINETLNSRANAFSGRIASVTANTTTTVTLDDVGTMNEYDYFLPAPPGYTHYRYLGAFYRDSAEVRNIADTGTIVGSRGSQNTQGSISGALGSAVEMPCDGHVSPLATGVKFSHTDTIGSSTTGDSVVRYGMDNGSHDTDEFYYQKDAATSQSFIFNFGCVPFSFHQRLWFYTGGALNIAANTRSMNIRGWIEP